MKIFLFSKTVIQKIIKFKIDNNNFSIKNSIFYDIKKINNIFNKYYLINKISIFAIKLKNNFFCW